MQRRFVNVLIVAAVPLDAAVFSVTDAPELKEYDD